MGVESVYSANALWLNAVPARPPFPVGAAPNDAAPFEVLFGAIQAVHTSPRGFTGLKARGRASILGLRGPLR
jgi:hypothetical protein